MEAYNYVWIDGHFGLEADAVSPELHWKYYDSKSESKALIFLFGA